MKIINVKNKKIYYNYNKQGDLVEIIIYDKNEIDINESWLND